MTMLRCLATLLALGLPATAAPIQYDLQPAESTVAFETDFGPDHITGQIPLRAADLVLDFEQLSNCKVAVTLDVTGADASFPFAAQALKGPKVLDAAAHPEMTFRSTLVKAAGEGAKVTGDLTIRGVTRRVTLDARIYRQKGTEEGDRSRMTVVLTGTVNRSDFGATGWSDMVADEVRITITARITRRG